MKDRDLLVAGAILALCMVAILYVTSCATTKHLECSYDDDAGGVLVCNYVG